MKYNKKFLISKLHRFIKENGRVPKMYDMQGYNYPSYATYFTYFGSWNNALLEAGLKINRGRLDGTETCDNCGEAKTKSQWYIKNGKRLCYNCYLISIRQVKK